MVTTRDLTVEFNELVYKEVHITFTEAKEFDRDKTTKFYDMLLMQKVRIDRTAAKMANIDLSNLCNEDSDADAKFEDEVLNCFNMEKAAEEKLCRITPNPLEMSLDQLYEHVRAYPDTSDFTHTDAILLLDDSDHVSVSKQDDIFKCCITAKDARIGGKIPIR